MLRANDLSIGYIPRSPLCAGVNLCACRGEVIALTGGNGVGKSTLLRTLSGEMRPLAGSVEIEDMPIDRISRHERARLISIVATEASMTGALTVRQLVGIGRQPYTGWTGILSSSDRRAVSEAMEATGIAPKADAPMATLSDGERQKAMIARALAQDTPLMMLDEPLSFLDPAARIEIFALLRSLASERKKSIILSCHDVALCLRMATRLWLFTYSREVISATPAEAVDRDIVSRLFSSPHVTFSGTCGDFIFNPHSNG